jgi:hypothetical protein
LTELLLTYPDAKGVGVGLGVGEGEGEGVGEGVETTPRKETYERSPVVLSMPKANIERINIKAISTSGLRLLELFISCPFYILVVSPELLII